MIRDPAEVIKLHPEPGWIYWSISGRSADRRTSPPLNPQFIGQPKRRQLQSRKLNPQAKAREPARFAPRNCWRPFAWQTTILKPTALPSHSFVSIFH